MRRHPVIVMCQIIAFSCIILTFTSCAQSPEQNPGSKHQVAKTLQPNDARSYFNRGKSHYTKGRDEEAIADFTKAIEIKPNIPVGYFFRGAAYFRMGDFDKAISDGTRAIALNPKLSWRDNAYYMRGRAYSMKGETDKALNDFTKATEINPKLPGAHFQIAIIEEKSGRLNEALRSYANFVKLAPSTDKRYYNNLKIAHKKLKELSKEAKAKPESKPNPALKWKEREKELAKFQDVSDVLKIEILKTTRTRKSQPVLQSASIRQGQFIWNVDKGSPKPGTVFILMKIALRNTGNDQRKFHSEHISFKIPQVDPLKYAALTSVKTKDGMVQAYSWAHKTSAILKPKESRPLEFLMTAPENYSGSIDIYYREKLFATAKTKGKIVQSKKKPVVKKKPVARNPNQQLLNAAENGQIQTLKKALAQGADVNFKNKHTDTPLILASWKGHTDCVKLLLENGAKVNIRNLKGTPALGPATQAGHRKIVELLLGAGAPVNSRINNHGGTALMLAAIHGHKDATDLLLKNGANVEAKNNDGTTPCMFASMNGRLKVLEILYENGANINATDIHGATPLMFAAIKGYPDITEYLIAKGAAVNANLIGETALIMATKNGHEMIVKILLKNGADVTAKDEWGQTALDIAQKKGQKNIIKLLQSN